MRIVVTNLHIFITKSAKDKASKQVTFKITRSSILIKIWGLKLNNTFIICILFILLTFNKKFRIKLKVCINILCFFYIFIFFIFIYLLEVFLQAILNDWNKLICFSLIEIMMLNKFVNNCILIFSLMDYKFMHNSSTNVNIQI